MDWKWFYWSAHWFSLQLKRAQSTLNYTCGYSFTWLVSRVPVFCTGREQSRLDEDTCPPDPGPSSPSSSISQSQIICNENCFSFCFWSFLLHLTIKDNNLESTQLRTFATILLFIQIHASSSETKLNWITIVHIKDKIILNTWTTTVFVVIVISDYYRAAAAERRKHSRILTITTTTNISKLD